MFVRAWFEDEDDYVQDSDRGDPGYDNIPDEQQNDTLEEAAWSFCNWRRPYGSQVVVLQDEKGNQTRVDIQRDSSEFKTGTLRVRK